MPAPRCSMAGAAPDLAHGISRAAAVLDSGAAASTLERLTTRVERDDGGGVMTTAARGFAGTGSSSDLLETIVAATRHTTAAREVRAPIEELVRRASQRQAQGRMFRDALRCLRSAPHHRRVQAAIAVEGNPAPGLRPGGARCRLRAGRGGGDLGAHRADILRWQPRAPGAGARGCRRAAAAQGLHRHGVSAAGSGGERRRRRAADRWCAERQRVARSSRRSPRASGLPPSSKCTIGKSLTAP